MPLNAKALKIKGPFRGPFSDSHGQWWELHDESARKSLGRFSSERSALLELERISQLAEERDRGPVKTSNSDLFDEPAERYRQEHRTNG